MKSIVRYITEKSMTTIKDTEELLDKFAQCTDEESFENILKEILPIKNKQKCYKALQDIRTSFKKHDLPGIYVDPKDPMYGINNLASTLLRLKGDELQSACRLISYWAEDNLF